MKTWAFFEAAASLESSRLSRAHAAQQYKVPEPSTKCLTVFTGVSVKKNKNALRTP